MAILRFVTDTTDKWKAVEDNLILKEREVAIEKTTDGYYLMRQGDGINKFFDLPIIVNNKRYEEILTIITEKAGVVTDISDAINQTIDTATAAAARAEKAAKDCEDIADNKGYVLKSSIHTANGVAGLDENGFLFEDQINFSQFSIVSDTEPASLATGGHWEKCLLKEE